MKPAPAAPPDPLATPLEWQEDLPLERSEDVRQSIATEDAVDARWEMFIERVTSEGVGQ